MEKINQFFKIKERKTNLRTEIIAGITTFMTMAYILVVQPALIVGNAGTIPDVNGVVTVSYTHLDVYKRQDKGSLYCCYCSGDSFCNVVNEKENEEKQKGVISK